MATIGQGFTAKFGGQQFNIEDDMLAGYPIINDNESGSITGTIKVEFGCFNDLFDNKPQKYTLIIGGSSHEKLKRLQKKRANKTKLSHRKRKRLYNKPLKYVFTGHVDDVIIDRESASITIGKSNDT